MSETTRADYPHWLSIPTRWMDNDIYGHVNNATYYSYFDTVINNYLIDEGGLEIDGDSPIGLAVETGCRFHAALAYPEVIDAGLRVAHLGRSSVRYEVGLFRADAPSPAAEGHFVHVFVDAVARRPVEIPDRLRTALARLSA